MECPRCKALEKENEMLRKLVATMADNSGFVRFLAEEGLKKIDEEKSKMNERGSKG